ncbi:FHA domain-containing protein [Microbulbifer sp. OS29]|uniref:FHA domain-containing protein n=1 Tax=Microbulbifer okhotskensis TaxID=2926617 RepID=A0A9X2EJV8_9GAMM|nr:FHA domain-containing protein [Microbulbifer okhotskensis]MCO1333577.1 FHA domain-containing protein [Microbulbifer okhotskensis]
MALIIEELNRAQRVQVRYRMDGDKFTLGRAYDNDAVLEDIHSDAHHAEIRRDEDGHYYLRDLDSVNGCQLLGNLKDKSVKPDNIEVHKVSSGDLLQCGKSRFRIFNSSEAMPGAVPLHSLENLFSSLSHPVGAILLLLCFGCASVLLSYLGYARTYQWTVAVNILATAMIAMVIYAGIWAFIGRVVKHETHFFTHLSIAALGALCYTAWEWLRGVINYNFAVGTTLQIMDFLVLVIILPAMLWSACYLATNLTRGWRWGVALALPLTFLGFGLSESISDINDFSELPEISTELKYDNMLFRTPVPMQDFIGNSAKIFDIPIKKKETTEENTESSSSEEQSSAPEVES